MKYIMDADATESEDSDGGDEEQIPSTSSAYAPYGYLVFILIFCFYSANDFFRSSPSHVYFNERVRLGALDAKALCMEEDCEEKISVVYRQVNFHFIILFNDISVQLCCSYC